PARTVPTTGRPGWGAAKVVGVGPARGLGQGDRRDLASEPRSRGRVRGWGRPAPDPTAREPHGPAGEPRGVRGDAPTQRRARAHQRRPAWPRGAPGRPGDV